MKKTTNLILTLLLVLSFTSCSRDETNEGEPNKYSDNTQKRSVEEELLKKGWKIIDQFEVSASLPKEGISSHKIMNKTNGKFIPLSDSHLKSIGYDIYTAAGRKKLKRDFAYMNIIPDGLEFNPLLSIDGHKGNNAPGLANVSIFVGNPIVTPIEEPYFPSESFTTEVSNDSDQENSIEKSYEYKTGSVVNWNTEVNGSFELGTEGQVGIPFVTSGAISTKINIGGGFSEGGQESTEKTLNSKYIAKVPGKHKVKITIVTTSKKYSVNYFVPIGLEGFFKANFPSKVLGHYFYKFDIKHVYNFLQNINGQKGNATVVENQSVKIFQSPAEPI
ncbi:hypothetical protein [Chryseobacterium nematophagum]|uniref:hypothetical protein n=1 Tax=Chryseobacterium nematophagum TaxID=2305228 RepID=UPI0011C4768F|nr:hypothetical protein [Chryseobacterium nematophagum]